MDASYLSFLRTNDFRCVFRYYYGVNANTVILPAGLSATRKDYLYRSVRPYVRPQYQDITCPAPAAIEEWLCYLVDWADVWISHWLTIKPPNYKPNGISHTPSYVNAPFALNAQSDCRIFTVRWACNYVSVLNTDNNKTLNKFYVCPNWPEFRLGAPIIAFVLTCSCLTCDVTSCVEIQFLYLLIFVTTCLF